MLDASTLNRFLDKVRWTKSALPGGCWEWTAYRNPKGYGVFGLRPRNKLAYRFFYEEMRGMVPKGMQLDHLCKNKSCVNPAHLEIVTPRENNDRAGAISSVYAARTHCKWGHLLDSEATYAHLSYRRCRKCAVETARKRYKAKKSEYIEASRRRRARLKSLGESPPTDSLCATRNPERNSDRKGERQG